MKYYDLLLDCAEVGKERGESYGTIEDNFSRWRAIHNSMFGSDLTEIQLCEVMISMKFSREANVHKTDNSIDAINYIAIREYLLRDKQTWL